MTTLTTMLLAAVVVLFLMVLGVLHFRVTKQQFEMAFDHAKVGHGIKQAFVKCKSWLSNQKHQEKSEDDDSSSQVRSMSA